jgi:hypothetical protein
MERVRAAGGEAVFARLDGIKKSLLTQSQAIRNIDKLPDKVMSPEQKRQASTEFTTAWCAQLSSATRCGGRLSRT